MGGPVLGRAPGCGHSARHLPMVGNINKPCGCPMSFLLYIIGLILLIGGVAWALVAAHVASTYVAIICLVVAGVGVMMAVSRTRLKDPPN